MLKKPKSVECSRVVAILSARNLAAVDVVAAATNVSREEALLQLLRLELSKHTATTTIH
jgi:hypothetical protein